MNDFKPYGCNDNEIDNLVKVVTFMSGDISMRFGFDKCAMLNIKGDSNFIVKVLIQEIV